MRALTGGAVAVEQRRCSFLCRETARRMILPGISCLLVTALTSQMAGVSL